MIFRKEKKDKLAGKQLSFSTSLFYQINQPIASLRYEYATCN